VVLSNAKPEMEKIDRIEVSPNQDEFIIHYTSDPGAYYDIETSIDLVNWTTPGTTFAEKSENSMVVTTGSADPKRFWRLRRAQQ
jgi:hypothetical protein